jgi:hypothetical protein
VAVGVILEFDGATLDQYDQVIQKMGFQPRGPSVPGCLFHWATPTANGFRVTDVWETREQFDQFAQEKIGPLAAEAGITSPPKPTFYEVHNYLTAG